MKSVVILVFTAVITAVYSFAIREEYYQSERCSDAKCRAAPQGTWCEPKYDSRDDGCCPEWKCENGQSVYGVRRSSSTVNGNNWNWNSDWKSSWSSGSKNGLDNDLGKWWGGKTPDFDLFGKPNRDPLFDRYSRR